MEDIFQGCRLWEDFAIHTSGYITLPFLISLFGELCGYFSWSCSRFRREIAATSTPRWVLLPLHLLFSPGPTSLFTSSFQLLHFSPPPNGCHWGQKLSHRRDQMQRGGGAVDQGGHLDLHVCAEEIGGGISNNLWSYVGVEGGQGEERPPPLKVQKSLPPGRRKKRPKNWIFSYKTQKFCCFMKFEENIVMVPLWQFFPLPGQRLLPPLAESRRPPPLGMFVMYTLLLSSHFLNNIKKQ